MERYSNRKGSHDDPRPRSTWKKRKFTGNQRTFEQSTASTSESVEKLLHTNDVENVIDPTHGYCMLQSFSFFSAISNLVLCKNCGNNALFRTLFPGLSLELYLK